MKKIALTQKLIFNKETNELTEGLDIRWGMLLKELGLIPIAIPIESDFKKILTGIDGIILTGGNDINSLVNNEINNKRDGFENDIIRFALSKKIPIIGICRGMEMIGQYFNATFKNLSEHVGTRHDLIINNLSRYYTILSMMRNVNSYHNFGIDHVSDDFIISALSSDASIEAIEHKRFKIWAQMWHPERDRPFNESQKKLIKLFFNSQEK